MDKVKLMVAVNTDDEGGYFNYEWLDGQELHSMSDADLARTVRQSIEDAAQAEPLNS